MKDIECPYCGALQEVCHDDGHGYSEDQRHEHECTECEKTFVFETFISFSYTPYKAECLNDGNHIWEATHSYPRKYSKLQCIHCWNRREPTNDERIIFGIPLVDSND